MLIYWTDEARTAIIEIKKALVYADYNGENTLTSLFRQIEQLADDPEIGKPYRSGELERVRQVIIENYRIIYCIENQNIDVLTIRCQARQIFL